MLALRLCTLSRLFFALVSSLLICLLVILLFAGTRDYALCAIHLSRLRRRAIHSADRLRCSREEQVGTMHHAVRFYQCSKYQHTNSVVSINIDNIVVESMQVYKNDRLTAETRQRHLATPSPLFSHNP